MKLIESKAEYIPQEEGLEGMYKQIELWKPVPNYEGLYEVSSKGRIRRLWKNSNKIKSQDTLRGYKKVTLFKNQIGKRFQVHRLVAQAFIPNPLELPQVNHKDENPSNNNVENLEWCTNLYNMRYGTAIKRQVEKRSKRVIQYDLNDNFIAEYCSTHDAALKTGFSQSSISMCCTGGYWRDNHTKFIKYKRVHNYKFKFKDEIN